MAQDVNDATTRLNAATTTGDLMDESENYQADGTTLAKRPRVDLAFTEPGAATNPLVTRKQPLPVGDADVADLLRDIREEMREIRLALYAFIEN